MAKLNYMRGRSAGSEFSHGVGVHKWEKRWVSKGSMMVFKWVRKAERCDFGGGGDTENREYANAIDHDQLAAAFGEPDVGQRRLTRGKAADMGTVVENLAETNDALLSNRRAPDASRKVQNSAGASEGGDTSRKRRRDEDDGSNDAIETDKRARIDSKDDDEDQEIASNC